MAFAGLAGFFMSRPLAEVQLEEKLVFMCFFAGAIVCMGLSFLYHTLCCHKDKKIGRLFAKFDYCGISFLTVTMQFCQLYENWELSTIKENCQKMGYLILIKKVFLWLNVAKFSRRENIRTK